MQDGVTTADVREVLLDVFPALGMQDVGDLDAAIEGEQVSGPKSRGGAKLDVSSFLQLVQQWAGPTWAVISIANFAYLKWKADQEAPPPTLETVLRDYEVEHGKIAHQDRASMARLAAVALRQTASRI